MSENSLSQIVTSRRSARSFTKQVVTKPAIEEMLELAGMSPSGSNLQPWKVYALAGEAKDELVKAVSENAMLNPLGEKNDIPIYPDNLEDPWRTRRFECGELMYQTLGIPRDDKMARIGQVFKNFSFFDAPVGLFFTMDRSLGQAQIIDLGIFIQTLVLLAHERGMASCPQASWTMWPETIRKTLKIDDREMIMCGMSLGYPNPDDAVNDIRQSRVGLDSFASVRGFD